MSMKAPSHPGETIRAGCLDPLDLTVTAAAIALGVTRKTLSTLLNGGGGVSPEMAIRLEKVFGGSAESWLTQQMQYDLWKAQQNADKIQVEKISLLESLEKGARDVREMKGSFIDCPPFPLSRNLIEEI